TSRGRPSVGSVTMVMRPGSRRSGLDSSRVVVSSVSSAGGCGGATRSISLVSSCAPVGSSSLQTGALPAKDDQTSRSSEGSDRGAGGSVRGISPGGGSVQCGSGPVSDAPKDRPSVVSSSESANKGGPKSSASSSSGRR